MNRRYGPPDANVGGGRDRGAASILVIAGSAVVLVGAVAAGALVTGSVLHTRADTAADLVAMATAARLVTDPDPCETAGDVARANDASLTDCSLDGPVVTVTVTIPTPPVWRRLAGVAAVASTSRAELVVDES